MRFYPSYTILIKSRMLATIGVESENIFISYSIYCLFQFARKHNIGGSKLASQKCSFLQRRWLPEESTMFVPTNSKQRIRMRATHPITVSLHRWERLEEQSREVKLSDSDSFIIIPVFLGSSLRDASPLAKALCTPLACLPFHCRIVVTRARGFLETIAPLNPQSSTLLGPLNPANFTRGH